MIRLASFAALSAAIVLGAAAPATANVILGGYFGANAPEQKPAAKTPAAKPPAAKTPAVGKKSEARHAKAAAPESQHVRSAKAAAPAGEDAGNVKAAPTASGDARSANASAALASRDAGKVKAAVVTGRDAPKAKASAVAVTQDDIDPRVVEMSKRKGGVLTWCDTNAQCNGWGEWLSDVQSGRRKAEVK